MAFGALNDSTQQSPLNLDIQLERFPLAKADPFLPGDGMDLRRLPEKSLPPGGNDMQFFHVSTFFQGNITQKFPLDKHRLTKYSKPRNTRHRR